MRPLARFAVLLAVLAGPAGARGDEEALPPPPKDRVRHFAVVCSSFSGSPQHAKFYWNSSTWIYRILKDHYGYDDANVYYLYEDPTRSSRQEEEADKTRKVVIDGQTNIENFGRLVTHLAEVVQEGDHVLFFMIGHAGHSGEDAWYNCVGNDLSSTAFAADLDRLKATTIVAIFSPCQTEAFLAKASKPGRVILTSTRSDENNSAGVAEAAIRGFEDLKYDVDKNKRLSVFEAYQSMIEEQRSWYAARGLPQQEHALLDDDGDGKGHYLPDGDAGDEGRVAKGVYLGNQGKRLSLSKAGLAWLAKANARLHLDVLLPAATDGR